MSPDHGEVESESLTLRYDPDRHGTGCTPDGRNLMPGPPRPPFRMRSISMRDAVHALSSNQSRRALAAWQRPNVRELFDSLVPTREELGAWTELLKIEFLRLRCQHTDRFAETAARADAGLIQSRGEGLTEDTETLRAWYAEDKCFMLACHRGLCAFWRREVAGLRAQRR